MFAIITYDIPTDQDGKKRYSKIHKLCGRCGFWVNNSVFEFDMDYTSFLRLKHNIEQIIDSGEDSVRIYIIRDSAENPRPTKSLGDECAATGLFRYPSMERMQLYI